MNIQEAIKSGKKYRRIGEKHWYETAPDFTHYAFSVQDVLSDDWEIQMSQVITTEQFFHTYTEALKETEIEDTYRISEVVNCLARRLGL